MGAADGDGPFGGVDRHSLKGVAERCYGPSGVFRDDGFVHLLREL